MTDAKARASKRWGTQSGSGGVNSSYNPTKFYIRSTNRNDHSTSTRPWPRDIAREEGLPETITLPPEMYAQITKFVESSTTDYRSQHDFWRDAAVHRLHQLNDMTKAGFEDYLDSYRARHELALIRAQNDDIKQTIKFFNSEVAYYAEEKNPHGIADIIATAKRQSVRQRHYKQWREAIAQWEKTQTEVEKTS